MIKPLSRFYFSLSALSILSRFSHRKSPITPNCHFLLNFVSRLDSKLKKGNKYDPKKIIGDKGNIPSFTAESSREVVQIKCPEHSAKQTVSFNKGINFQSHASLVIISNPLIIKISIWSIDFCFFHHSQPHCTYLKIGEKSS